MALIRLLVKVGIVGAVIAFAHMFMTTVEMMHYVNEGLDFVSKSL